MNGAAPGLRPPHDPDLDPFATGLFRRAASPRPATTGAGGASATNPLIREADALLELVPRLRASPQVADLAQLRARIVARLGQFEEGARQRGVAPAQREKARLVLCALIDEVAETMPWGAAGQWDPLRPPEGGAAARAQGMRIRQLAQMAEDRDANRDLRELIYVAIALGFEAGARAPATAPGQPEQVRARLAELLRREPAGTPSALSVRWQPAVGRSGALASWLPLWVGSFAVAALLAVLYFSLALSLASQSDRVYAQIAALRLPSGGAPRGQPAAATQPRLAPVLPAEPGLLVRNEIDRSVVTLPEAALFEPGTAGPAAGAAGLLRSVAAALQRADGRVLVVGYADRASPRSARFPSGWELSLERARVVRDALQGAGVAAARLRYDGRGDTEPPGRIEIVLLAGR